MNNFEQNKNEIERRTGNGATMCKVLFELRTGDDSCSNVNCADCEKANIEWLLAEYEEPKEEPNTEKYRKKPVVVEAYQTNEPMIIHTLEGDMRADIGDYIITGVNGEQYPCKPDIFDKTYEKVDGEPKDDGWHDLEVNPKDVPETSGQYLVRIAEEEGNLLIHEYYSVAHYLRGENEWRVDGTMYFNSKLEIGVKEWKEIE